MVSHHTRTTQLAPKLLTRVPTSCHTVPNQSRMAYLSLGRRYRLDVEHSAQQVVDHLALVLLASLLDLLDLGLGLLVRLLLGLLVSLGVLESFEQVISHGSNRVYMLVEGGTRC